MPSNDATPTTTTTESKSRSMFVGVGENGLRIVSANGLDWEKPIRGKEGEVYRAVCYGNGRYAAVGSYGGNNILAATRDGLTWKTSGKEGQYRNYIRGIGFGHGAFLALAGDPGSIGSSAPSVLTSEDGVAWSDYQPIAGKAILRRIAWGSGLFVGVGDRGRRAASKDGKEWVDAPDSKAIDTLIDVAFGGPTGKEVFVGVGLHGLRMTTRDGLAWSNRITGEEGEHCNTVVWTGDHFVAVGQGGTYFSPDGFEWNRKPNNDAPTISVYGNPGGKGLFVGASWLGLILASDDAVKWRKVYEGDSNIEALCYGSG